MVIAALSVAWAQCLAVAGRDLEGEPLALRIEDGRIAAVAARPDPACEAVELPADAVLTPGVIELTSSVGLAEVSAEAPTVHHHGSGDPIRATLRVSDAFDPASVHVPVMRLGGVTSAIVHPRGGFVAGQAGWVALGGAKRVDAVREPSLAFVVDLGGRSRAQALAALRELLLDAREHARSPSLFESRHRRSFEDGASHHDLQALESVATGRAPIVVYADRAAAIEAVLDLAEELGLDLVIAGAAEGWKLAERLASAGVPVIVDPMVYGAGGFDQRLGRADNPALLAAAGVSVMLSSSTHNMPIMTQLAGNAVRGGMPHAAAVDAITVAPLRAFGVPGPHGLVPGARADVVAWSGDPLEIGSRPLWIAIDGQPQPLDSRQRALFRRYRELPGSPLPPLDLRPVE